MQQQSVANCRTMSHVETKFKELVQRALTPQRFFKYCLQSFRNGISMSMRRNLHGRLADGPYFAADTCRSKLLSGFYRHDST